jgi:hypothetical protein
MPSGTPRLDLPGSGDTVIVSVDSEDADETSLSRGVTVNLSPNASWANFGGVCTYVQGTLERVIPCGSATVQSTVSRGGLRRTTTTHSALIRAYDPLYPDTVVASASYPWTETWLVDTGDCNPVCK